MTRRPALSRRSFITACSALAIPSALAASDPLAALHTPPGGLQPQSAVDNSGVLHVVYLAGDPASADVYYVRKAPSQTNFSAPMRVNSRPGSAVALGTVRGAHLAIGRNARIHVAWNGSSAAQAQSPRHSTPMLYTRLNDAGLAFEPERNLMQISTALDGGGTVAADSHGNVYVAWHGQSIAGPVAGEQNRRVWLAKSNDEGRTFSSELAVSPPELGACGCCGMGALADRYGNLYLAFRSARQLVHRDMYLLLSNDRAKTFRPVALQPWNIAACPMSTVSLADASAGIFVAWETRQQVFFATLDRRTGSVSQPVSAPGAATSRKHPSIAVNNGGQILLAWTEGTGWKKGGSVAWQIFDSGYGPVAGSTNAAQVPAWSFPTAAAAGKEFLLMS